MRTKRSVAGLTAGIPLLSLLLIVRVLVAQPTTTISAQEAVEPVETHLDVDDLVWDSTDVTSISLTDDSITVDGIGSPELTRGATYEVYLGGTIDRAAVDGVYESGNYSGDTLYTTFTVNDVVTMLGSRGGMGMGGRGFGRP